MKIPTTNMTTNPIDLLLELHSADGMVAEFYQSDSKRIGKTLRLLATPGLFTHPELILASERQATSITTRAIDVILARTGAPLPKIFPLNSPAGPIDISVAEDACDDSLPAVREGEGHYVDGMIARTFRVEVQTLGGWANILEVSAQVHGTVQDRRLTYMNVFHLPVIPFKLRTGGIGFINPTNLIRATAYPPPDSLPETALPLELLRWTPSRPKTTTSNAGAIQL